MIHGQQPQRDEWGTAGNEEENMTRESAVSLCSPSRCPSGRDDTKWRGSQFKGSVVRIVHVKYTLSTEQTITQSCNRKIASYHQWSSGVGDEHRRSSVPLINTGRGLIQLGWMKCDHYFILSTFLFWFLVTPVWIFSRLQLSLCETKQLLVYVYIYICLIYIVIKLMRLKKNRQ